MNPKDVIMKMASVAAIVLAVYIALIGFHQTSLLLSSMYYIMSGIIIVGALIVIVAKVE
jgi:hypothetical protein